MSKVLLFGALLAPLFLMAACVSTPAAPKANPTLRVVTPDAVATPDAAASPAPTVTSRPVGTPTSPSLVPDVSSLVEDCMEACHIPEASEFYDAGAMPQPANHTGRTTCLECHGKPDIKPLPATHLGRLDPSCATCHK